MLVRWARSAVDWGGIWWKNCVASCRLALHLRRAAMIRSNQDPGTPNECILLIGPSGGGKTWLVETAGRACGIPFASISATDITSEGYIGMGIDDGVKRLISDGNDDVEKARFGVLFVDEWDKKRSSNWEFGGRDVAGASVQQEVLRLIEGTVFQVGGRKGSWDWAPTTFNSRGTAFAFAGAFTGLQELLDKRGGHGIGFGPRQRASARCYLLDALVDYGMIVEFVNRISTVLMLPEPTVGQLREIAVRSVIPAFNRILTTFGAGIEPDLDATTLMADIALETGTYARGIKSIVTQLVEDIVFEVQQGTIRLGVDDVRRAVEESGLGLVASEN